MHAPPLHKRCRTPHPLHGLQHTGAPMRHVAHTVAAGSSSMQPCMPPAVPLRRGYATNWDAYGLQYEQAFRQWPMMVATGNHERVRP